MIVVKLLYDKFELDTLPGRITLGILVFQDIWAILFLAIQHDLKNPAPVQLLLSLVKGVAVVALAFLLSRYLLPILFRSVAKLPEVILIAALGWCFGISLLASSVGLSREMGALIAGVALSAFPYNLDVVAKIVSLRDFFITLFFVSLGTTVPRPSAELLGLSFAASAFLVASRFLTISPILRLLKSGNRISFVAALNLSQISEFSLVICALGVSLGHIPDQVLSVVVYTLVLTSVGSTYAILNSHAIFTWANPLLKRLGLRDIGDRAPAPEEKPGKPIVFLGFSRYASSLLVELSRQQPGIEQEIAVVDFNPDVKRELDRRGIANLYGDISHTDVLHHAKVHDARVVLSTVPDSILKGTTNLRLLRQLSAGDAHSQVIVTAEFFYTARELYQEGAAFVFLPRLMNVRDLAKAVLAARADDLESLRSSALAELEERQEVLP
jgi:Trk K+ transport system NAD-binding subunit